MVSSNCLENIEQGSRTKVRLPCCLGAFCLEPFWGCCLFRFLPFWGKHEWGNGFRGFLCFSLPFSLLAGSKGIGFCWVSLFSLPFGNHTYFKGNGFLEFPRFSLPPPSGTLSSALLFRKSSAEYFLGNYSGSMYGNQ